MGVDRGRASAWVGRGFKSRGMFGASEDDDEVGFWDSSLGLAVALKAAARDLPAPNAGLGLVRAFGRFGGLFAGLGLGT